jgi:hypothetical protein
VLAGGYCSLARWFLAKLVFLTLKMKAVCSSETSVDTQRTTRRYIPEDDTLHNHHCENLKSYIISAAFLLLFSLSLSRETWTQELLQVVKVIVDSTGSVPRTIKTRCLIVDISILYNYLLFLHILTLCVRRHVVILKSFGTSEESDIAAGNTQLADLLEEGFVAGNRSPLAAD